MPDRFRVFHVIVAAPAQWTPTHSDGLAHVETKAAIWELLMIRTLRCFDRWSSMYSTTTRIRLEQAALIRRPLKLLVYEPLTLELRDAKFPGPSQIVNEWQLLRLGLPFEKRGCILLPLSLPLSALRGKQEIASSRAVRC